jgi:hypothetical protein
MGLPKDQCLPLSPNAVILTLKNFLQELKDMFTDLNHAATAMQKLLDARQGTNPVETIISLNSTDHHWD